MNLRTEGALRRTVGLSILLGFWCGVSLAQQSGTGQSQDNGATSLSQSNENSKLASGEGREQQIKRMLLAELDSLIPGELNENDSVTNSLQAAIGAFGQGKVDDATKILNQLCKSNPEFPPVELLQAGLLYAVGNSSEGFRFLEDASQKNPAYPGVCYAFARLAVSQQRLSDALAQIEKARRLLGDSQWSESEKAHFSAQEYDTLIDIGLRRKDFALVRENVAKLKEVTPENSKIDLTLAELAFADKDYETSFEKLQKFHKSNPKSRLPELVMASWFQQQGDAGQTQSWVTKAAEAYPGNANVQLEFANFAVGKGDFPQATAAVKKVEDQVGEIPATMLLKGKMAFANEAYGMAEMHYEKLSKAQPQNFDASNMYALALIENESEEKRNLALAIVQRNYQQLPDNPVAQAAFGWVLLKAGQLDKAKSLLSRSARTPDLAPEVAFFLASYFHQSGSPQQAKLVLEPALESSGLFLYRSAARRLLTEIEASNRSLPSPGGD